MKFLSFFHKLGISFRKGQDLSIKNQRILNELTGVKTDFTETGSDDPSLIDSNLGK